jgi:chromosome segregation ATPase
LNNILLDANVVYFLKPLFCGPCSNVPFSLPGFAPALQEKDKLLSVQSEMHSKGQELEQKVESLEEHLSKQGSTLDSLGKDYKDLKEQHQSLLREKAILEGRLEEVLNALSSLEQDKARCEKALEATKTKLQESQSQTARAYAKKDQLVKDLSQVLHERDEFKVLPSFPTH